MTAVCTSYRVEFSSGSWREVGRINRTHFEALRAALRVVAEAAPGSASYVTEREPVEAGEVSAGPLTARYEVDHATATVLVIELSSGGGARTGTA